MSTSLPLSCFAPPWPDPFAGRAALYEFCSIADLSLLVQRHSSHFVGCLLQSGTGEGDSASFWLLL